MTPDQIALVEATATAVEVERDRFGRCFSEILAVSAPGLAARLTDRPELPRMIGREIVGMARTVGELSGFLAEARVVAARWEARGLRPGDHPVLGGVLIEALRAVLGPSFDQAAADAWRCVYLLASESILESGTRRLFVR